MAQVVDLIEKELQEVDQDLFQLILKQREMIERQRNEINRLSHEIMYPYKHEVRCDDWEHYRELRKNKQNKEAREFKKKILLNYGIGISIQELEESGHTIIRGKQIGRKKNVLPDNAGSTECESRATCEMV